MTDQEFLHSSIHGSLLAVISKPHRGCWALLLAAWTWAIWSCAEYWRGNPNYSYGWIVPVLGFAYAARRLTLAQNENIARPIRSVSIWLIGFFGIVVAAIIFGLEFAREQVWHPIIIIWTIAFIPITLTLLICWFTGGKTLLIAELFPVLFFLTAVPWPPRFEQPITAGLMQAVAGATTAVLHWFGIPAQTTGGAITLRTGVVGITEACSGMRSLQAGVMFGLAMGEWFLLRPLRRIALLLLAIVLALCTNLIRTLALSLQAEWHGLDAVEKIHDLTGTLAVTVLVIAIWISALALRSRHRAIAQFGFENLSARLRAVGAAIPATLQRAAAAVLIAGIFGIAIVQIVSAKIDARDQTQTAPFFPCGKIRRKRGCNCRAMSGTSSTLRLANTFASAIRGWAPERLFISFGNRRRGTDSPSFIAPISACPESAGKAVARRNRSRSIFPDTQCSSIFFDFGAATLKLLSCGASGEMATRSRSIINLIKFCALPQRHLRCISKASDAPPPKSLLVSLVEIVFIHRRRSERSQF